ncbi:MAG: Uma2 family endonuclease [Spirulinaceae cyanobacterium]
MPVLNLVKLPITTVDLSPGSHLLIEDVPWEQYEAFLMDLGEERRVPRINYCNGILELMAPLPAHERLHRIIAYIVTAILDAQGRDWEDFGSTTFRKPQKAGLEPDTCFYIQNAQRVHGLMRMNMAKDPPPDLAIEADVTSPTTLAAYATLKVPEVWIYDRDRLTIYLLQNNDYQVSRTSRVFPSLDITTGIPKLVQGAIATGTSAMLRKLRRRLQAGEKPF